MESKNHLDFRLFFFLLLQITGYTLDKLGLVITGRMGENRLLFLN